MTGEARQQRVDRRLQLVKPPVLSGEPGAVLCLMNVPERAGTEREQVLEFAVIPPCY